MACAIHNSKKNIFRSHFTDTKNRLISIRVYTWETKVCGLIFKIHISQCFSRGNGWSLLTDGLRATDKTKDAWAKSLKHAMALKSPI